MSLRPAPSNIRLVNYASEYWQGRAIFLKVYSQAPKPVRPTFVEVTFHSKTVGLQHDILLNLNPI